MKRIRIVLLSGFLFILLLLSGCVTKEQEEKNAANLARAEINAVNYVKEKYGFTAEITSSEIERDGGMFGPSFTNHAYVNMSYNGKDFTVYINGKNTNTDGVDDYQAAAITEALQAKLDSIVGHDSVYILSENFYRKPDSDSDSGYGFILTNILMAKIFQS